MKKKKISPYEGAGGASAPPRGSVAHPSAAVSAARPRRLPPPDAAPAPRRGRRCRQLHRVSVFFLSLFKRKM